jgi:hypothetical protein
MFYSDSQSFLNFLTIFNRLEVGVFDRAVKRDSPGTTPFSKEIFENSANVPGMNYKFLTSFCIFQIRI